MLESFFTEERVHGGWRFWVLWVVMTIVGFIAGLAVERLVFGSITLTLSVPLAAIFQAWAINRHIVIFIPWILVTSIGWWFGVFTASIALNLALPDIHPAMRVLIIGSWSGFVVGIPQWLLLRGQVKEIGIWWIPLSMVGWAVGMITGIPLAYYIEYKYRDLVYRAWKKPESAEAKPGIPTNSEPTKA